ncbi:MAG: hypothetical protein K6D59_01805 [Bacteroidales bacterium]|nr:hypothetical protein [Bacteroidales bacterium]
MHYTAKQVSDQCNLVKRFIRQGKLHEAVGAFVEVAIAEPSVAWCSDNIPGDQNKEFHRLLCEHLMAIYPQLDYRVRLYSLWERLLCDKGLQETIDELKRLNQTLPNNQFIMTMFAYAYNKIGFYKTCLYYCKRLEQDFIGSGFTAYDQKSIDFMEYLEIDCLYELGEFHKMLDKIESLDNDSEYMCIMRILAYRGLRMFDEAVAEAESFLCLNKSADVRFFHGHILYLKGRMDLAYDDFCHIIENNPESIYTPFCMAYLGEEEAAIELSQKRARDSSFNKFIKAEILSLTGKLDEAYNILKEHLMSPDSSEKGRTGLLFDPALQRLLLEGNGIELVNDHISQIEKRDEEELRGMMNRKEQHKGKRIELPYSIDGLLKVVTLRVDGVEARFLWAPSSERTVLSNTFKNDGTHHFLHRSREFGELMVSEGFANINIGGWKIEKQSVLFCDNMEICILGGDILSKAQAINTDTSKLLITITI